MTKEKTKQLATLLKQWKEEKLNQAQTPRRAWKGRLEYISKFLNWLYDKDILTQSQKNKKNSVFRQYYRFYNDGDLPGVLKRKGYSNYDFKYDSKRSKQGQLELEKYLDQFIKKMLGKYFSRKNRTDFHYDLLIEDLEDLIRNINNGEYGYGLNYWKKDLSNDDTKFNQLIQTARQQFEKFTKQGQYIVNNSQWKYKPRPYYTNDFKKKLVQRDLWTKRLQSMYQDLKQTFQKLYQIAKNVLQTVKKAKELRLNQGK